MEKQKNLTKLTAFTLAEVLITLTIIGVIAAVTIPTLMQKNLEQEMVTKLKKNYSILANAFTQAIHENGPIDEWEIGTQATQEGGEKIFNYIKPYLKVSKDCKGESGCFASSYKALFDNTSAYSSIDSLDTRYKFILEDGTSVALWSTNKGCYNMQDRNKVYKKECADIWVDLNNVNGPNRVGVDMQRFVLSENNLVPSGVGYPQLILSNSNKCAYNETGDRNGVYCATHVIYKGNMNYLHKKIDKEWENYFVEEEP